MVDKYIGQTYGPAGMGMSAYSNIPDPIFSESLTVNELGSNYGPVGMGMPAYMDRPGPMEIAGPPDNIGYDRMGPDLEPGLIPNFQDMYKKRYIPNPGQQGLGMYDNANVGPGPWNDFGLDYNNMPTQSQVFEDYGKQGRIDLSDLILTGDMYENLKLQGLNDESIKQIYGPDALQDIPLIGYSTETAGLGSDIYNYLDDMLDFEGMKDQIPYMLDNLIPFYEPPEGYYDETDEWKEEIV